MNSVVGSANSAWTVCKQWCEMKKKENKKQKCKHRGEVKRSWSAVCVWSEIKRKENRSRNRSHARECSRIK